MTAAAAAFAPQPTSTSISTPPTPSHRVAVLALDGIVPFDLGVAVQVFGTARDEDGRRHYQVLVASGDGGPVRSEGGFEIRPDHGPEVIDTARTLVVPGIAGRHLLTDDWALDETIAGLLRGFAQRGGRLISLCTGAFVLADAGLLEGRRVATHWWWADLFRRRFPGVRLDPEVLFIDDGDVLTSAGVGAGLDLCLHVVRTDHGSEVANRAARRCVVPPWRDGGQAQFIERPMPIGDGDGTADARAWAVEHLEESIDLATMAARARMSVRTFTRRFRAETGQSPGAWLLHQRIERARQLLEVTDLAVDQVARDAGFGTGASLRQHFRAAVGIAPVAYRQTFRRR